MSDKLNPCPICGKQVETGNFAGVDWFVFCDCGIEFAPKNVDTFDELAARWNRRASEWISVKDRLPEKTGKYIVHQWRTGETSDCDYYHRDDPYTTFPGWEYEHEKISHWMPFPHDPEEEE